MNEKIKISNCEFRFEFECPKNWEDLEKSDDDNVRNCRQYNQKVYFAENKDQLINFIFNKKCVAVATGNRGRRLGRPSSQNSLSVTK